VAPPFLPADLEACLRVLEALAQDRSRLHEVPEALREQLLELAGRVNWPERTEIRRAAKARRKRGRVDRRDHDDALVAATAMRRVRALPVYVALGTTVPAASLDGPVPAAEGPAAPPLREARSCYVCKRDYHQLHGFYDSMCPPCGDFNFAKRSQSVPLDGKIALVTGARMKIGFQTALILLRAGARVIATTRFPHDAAARFAREPDHECWSSRLTIYGLDLRHAPSVEHFGGHLDRTLPRLDVIVHNAAQTVRRPVGFYRSLLAGEEVGHAALPAAIRGLVADHHALVAGLGAPQLAAPGALVSFSSETRAPGLAASARLALSPLTPEDVSAGPELFPGGRVDQDLQQVDLRPMNSWRMPLAEVGTPELLEVHLVNAIAPFILNRALTPLLRQDPGGQKHIIHVSAMEASFSRKKKTDKHPHTNMAKAALNMLTRTSAAEYAEYGVWMNSVDTGWVTDEDPLHHVARKQREHDFYPPLDVVDGAARVLDPLFVGLLTGSHPWGKFWKDYRVVDW
jgi:NAD(P)-dependent dehydrogenase (short-subunit alcohol dehydrogenase family)